MNIKEQYSLIVDKIKKISPEAPDYFEMPVIQEEIELFSQNLRDTIEFLDNDCTADQLSWLCEVVEEISEKLQSWEFIDALKRAADRFPEECRIYNIRNSITYAEGVLSEGVYKQRPPEGYSN